MPPQDQRREETRVRLLDAAGELFADTGVEGAPVDAIAARADRTSGSIYAHFGSKEGLLIALLDSWLGDAAAVLAAELVAAPDVDERLLALWRGFAAPERQRWVQLEHELWLYATRHPDLLDRVADRYRQAARHAGEAFGNAGALTVALLIGMQMLHRAAPDLVDDDAALAGLRALTTVTEGTRS